MNKFQYYFVILFLFNIYVSSLPSIVKNLGFKTSIYADDSNARLQFSLHFQYYNIMVRIPELIEEITSWMHVHFLKINPEKTELILFCPPSTKDASTIQGVFLSNSCLRFSKSVRLLGVNLDPYLNLESHVNNFLSFFFIFFFLYFFIFLFIFFYPPSTRKYL